MKPLKSKRHYQVGGFMEDPKKDPPSYLDILMSLGPKAAINAAKGRLYENIRPQGYDKATERLYNALVLNEAERGSPRHQRALDESLSEDQRLRIASLKGADDYTFSERGDLLKALLGLGDDNLEKSPYREGAYRSPRTERMLINQLKGLSKEDLHDEIVKMLKDGPAYHGTGGNNVLGNFTVDYGEDEKGSYIDYYDVWDLNPFSQAYDTKLGEYKDTQLGKALSKAEIMAQEAMFGAKAPEVYGRVYLDDIPKDEEKGPFKQEIRDIERKELGGMLGLGGPKKMKPLKSKRYYQVGGSTADPKKRPLLNNPDTVRQLLSALQEYGSRSEQDATDASAIREGSKKAQDFMTRYYQSPYYKKMVGGRDMLLSDQGFEDSAEGERLRNVGFRPVYSEDFYGGMKPYYSSDEDAPFQGDLRNPYGSVEMSTYDPLIQTGDKKRVRGIDDPYTYIHELSHATGEPVMRGFMFDGQFETGPSLGMFDRSMIEGNPSRVPPSSASFGFPVVQDAVFTPRGESVQEAIDKEAEADRKRGDRPDVGIPITRSADDIADQEYVVTKVNYDGSKYDRNPRLVYLQNPTEIAARMRAVTARLQDKGVMDKDDFDLSYENLYKAYKDGDDQARELLEAMGVVNMRNKKDLSDKEAGTYDYQKGRRRTVAETAKKNFNRYLRGKI